MMAPRRDWFPDDRRGPGRPGPRTTDESDYPGGAEHPDGGPGRPGWDTAQRYGPPDGYEAAPGYGDPDGYGGTGGYDRAGGYNGAGSYGGSAGYGGPAGYEGAAGYEQQAGYGGSAGYGSARYSGAAGYDAADAYDGTGSYRTPNGNLTSDDYSDQHPSGPGGYGGLGEYGDQTGFGSPGGTRGRHSTSGPHTSPQDPYGPDPYGQDPYGQGSYGQGGYGAGRDPEATSSYQRPDQYDQRGASADAGGYGDTGSFGLADSAAFDRPDTGTHGLPGTGSFGPADSSVLGRPDTGEYDRPGRGAFGRPDTGTFGVPDPGSPGWADSGTFSRPGYPADSGTFDRADSGVFRHADSGVFDRADSGVFDRADSGVFNPVDSGVFDPVDSGVFSRRDPGAAGRDNGHPGRESRGSLPDNSGYADWLDDPGDRRGFGAGEADDEWDDDDAGRGLLSRRFGRGGGGGDDDDYDGGGGRPRRRRGKIAVTIAVLAVFGVLGGVVSVGYDFVNHWITSRYGDYPGPGYGTVQVTVKPGSALVDLGPTLVQDGVIMAVRPFDTAAGNANASSLQPGVYKLHHHMNAALAVNLLLSSKSRINDKVTIIEGWRASRIAATLAKLTGKPVSDFLQIIDHPQQLGLPSWAAGKTAEGFLYPDTYTLLPDETPLQILKAMVTEFNQKTAGINLVAEAKKVNTTPWHVLIVASMVQAEAGSNADMGKIARVAWNRLSQGIKLDFDSTVFYGLNTYGTSATDAQIHKPTPYNTYMHTGLPPGPISNPGMSAIDAALHPTHGTWTYFITDTRHKPYVTYFTSSYTQFQQWYQQFRG